MIDSCSYSPRLLRLGLFLGFLAPGVFPALLDAQEAPAGPAERTGVLIRLEGPITPLMEQYLFRQLNSAEVAQAGVVILEIDSPGGSLDATFQIVDRLLRLKGKRTIAYVPREAISGAAIIALACEEVWMHPSAQLGDAGPIFMDETFMFQHAPQKIRSPLAARVREIARVRDRPAALLEAMVDMDLEVFRVRNRQTGAEAMMSEAEIASSADPAAWEKVQTVLESRKGNFLTVSGTRAAELQMIEGTVEDRASLLTQLGVTGEVTQIRKTWVDTAVTVLNSPWLTGLLLVIGLVALYVELSSPGIGVGAAVAILCFSLFFWSRFLGGTSTWLEVVLFVSGMVLIGMEFFVIPGFGVTGVTGLLLVLVSLLMASQEFVIPRTYAQWETFGSSLVVLTGSSLLFLVVAATLGRYYRALPILSRLELKPPASDEVKPGEKEGDAGGKPGGTWYPLPVQAGDCGTTISPLRPAGKVDFAGNYVDVVSEGAFVERDRPVRIVKIEGNRVVVREAPPEANT